jgi:nicotinate-nucleotide adenylyltransferase
MRIGLFGGTFDPPHLAHLAVAEAARSYVNLARLIWIPAGIPPHRIEQPIASPAHRLAMTELSVRDNSAFSVSEIEIEREGRSFTYETAAEASGRYPDDELFLVVGGDSLRNFHTWRKPEEILAKVRLIAFARDRSEVDDVEPTVLDATIVIPGTPLLGISSSKIRKLLAAGRSIRYLVTEPVAEYIEEHNLYRPSDTSNSERKS